MPTTTVLHITCTDLGGLSSSDFIYIEISPINEHDPVLDKTHLDIEVWYKCKMGLIQEKLILLQASKKGIDQPVHLHSLVNTLLDWNVKN